MYNNIGTKSIASTKITIISAVLFAGGIVALLVIGLK